MYKYDGIKVVALDIYDSVLHAQDSENVMPPRRGLKSFFDLCDRLGVPIVGSSDGDTCNVKCDLKQCFENHPECGLSDGRFANFFQLDQPRYKDYSIIYGHYGIEPWELLAIDDNVLKGKEGAIVYGCQYLEIPAYSLDNSFDFSLIEINGQNNKNV